jgi:hypothetical protein
MRGKQCDGMLPVRLVPERFCCAVRKVVQVLVHMSVCECMA